MAQSDCARFEAILDRLVGDEGGLQAEEEAFLAEHPSTCSICALSLGLYEEMIRSDPAEQSSTAGDDEWVDSVVAAAQERRTIGRFFRAGGRASAAAVIVLAVVPAAAMVALAWVVWPVRTDDQEDRTHGADPGTNSVATDDEEHSIEPDQRDDSGQTLPDTTSDDAASSVESEGEALVARVDGPRAGETDPVPGLADGSTEHKATIPALLAQARKSRAEQDWSGESAAYELLIETYPESSEATMCLVPLGQVQLEQLEQPQQALASFREYVHDAPAGPLLEEAQWGEADALYELGRTDEARDALQRFLDHHPGSLYAPQASERLESGGER